MCGFFFQAEGGLRGFCLSRGLGGVYKGQARSAGDNRAAADCQAVGTVPEPQPTGDRTGLDHPAVIALSLIHH